jgi:hypothetical protein
MNSAMHRVVPGIRLTAAITIVFAALPAWSQSSGADSANDQLLEEIVVTATKSGSIALDKVPIAIQAFSKETLKLRGVY